MGNVIRMFPLLFVYYKYMYVNMTGVVNCLDGQHRQLAMWPIVAVARTATEGKVHFLKIIITY